MVVDDLKVSDHVAFASGAEADLRLGFPSSLGVDGEVSGFVDLDTCSNTRFCPIETKDRKTGFVLNQRASFWICAAANPKNCCRLLSCFTSRPLEHIS